jgi:hypothetical protein
VVLPVRQPHLQLANVACILSKPHARMNACVKRTSAPNTTAELAAALHADVSSEGFSKSLQQPTPFAAVDSINPDETGRLKFHYVVVEVSGCLRLDFTKYTLTKDTVHL